MQKIQLKQPQIYNFPLASPEKFNLFLLDKKRHKYEMKRYKNVLVHTVY
jgi:hypothetical protein